MIVSFSYPLRVGNKVVGYYNTTSRLLGVFLEIPELSVLKQPYNQKCKTIKVPIKTRVIEDHPPNTTLETYLDVSHKSDRQISLIIQRAGWL